MLTLDVMWANFKTYFVIRHDEVTLLI